MDDSGGDSPATTTDAAASNTGSDATGNPILCEEGATRDIGAGCIVELCQGGAWVQAPALPGHPCDDGVPCTANSTCNGGTCGGGIWVCQCDPDAPPEGDLSCSNYSPANKCKGKLSCVAGVNGFYSCELDPTTVVTCDPSKDETCVKNWCDPKIGSCAMTPIETIKGAPVSCEDGDTCTYGDLCKSGSCVSGAMLCQCTASDLTYCYVGLGFVDNTCKGKVICVNPGAGAPPPNQPKENWTHCAYDTSKAVTCSTAGDGPCATTSCVATNGVGTCTKSASMDGTLCDDGEPCTVNDLCFGGSCKAGELWLCQCKVDADCAAKSTGPCDGVLFCDQTTKSCKIVPGSPVTCPDAMDGPCLQTICDLKTGQCKAVPSEQITFQDAFDSKGGLVKIKVDAGKPIKLAFCDDGNSCTFLDECSKGSCKEYSTNDCPQCAKDADCASSDDDNLCNGTAICNAGQCEPNLATIVNCVQDDNTCTSSVCEPKTGKCMTKSHAPGTQCKTKATCAVADGTCNSAAVCQPWSDSCK